MEAAGLIPIDLPKFMSWKPWSPHREGVDVTLSSMEEVAVLPPRDWSVVGCIKVKMAEFFPEVLML